MDGAKLRRHSEDEKNGSGGHQGAEAEEGDPQLGQPIDGFKLSNALHTTMLSTLSPRRAGALVVII